MIDFSLIYKTYAERWKRYFLTQIKQRTDWDGTKKYSVLASSTVAAGKTKGGKRSPNSRMNDTGAFAQRAVVAKATNTELSVKTNDQETHPEGKITFAKIREYNDAESPKRNKDIKDPPRIFPVPKDAAKLRNLPLYQKMVIDMKRAAEIQTGKTLNQTFAKQIIVDLRK